MTSGTSAWLIAIALAVATLDGPSARDSRGEIDNYKAMPDNVGIHLGMPSREALAVLRREYSKQPIFPTPFALPELPAPPPSAYKANPATIVNESVALGQGRRCSGGPGTPDVVYVSFTGPPNPQVVHHVRRCMFPAQPLHRDVLLKSLREKYGKETIAFPHGGTPTTRDADMNVIYWLFDESGQPAPAPEPADWFTLDACPLLTCKEAGKMELTILDDGSLDSGVGRLRKSES